MGNDLLPVLTDNGSYIYIDVNSMSLSELISLRDYVIGSTRNSVSVIDAAIGRLLDLMVAVLTRNISIRTKC